MTMPDLTPLRLALYAPGAPLRGMRLREVRTEVGPIIRRKAYSRSRMRTEYIRTADITEYLSKHGKRDELQLFS
ncbi:MAG: hypothetical protein ACI9YM_001937 [Brevundimonas sp.]|jgi:hypothetical protein